MSGTLLSVGRFVSAADTLPRFCPPAGQFPRFSRRASTWRRGDSLGCGQAGGWDYGWQTTSKMKSTGSEAGRIVPITEADLPALIELAGVIWRQHYPGIITTEQIEYMLGRMYALETLREELRSGIRFWQLVVADRMVGFASMGLHAEPSVMKLHKCYLLPALHGRGLGTVLLRHCEHAAAQLGARRLILAVNKNNPKAIAAYQRNGFVIADSVRVDIGGGFVMDDYVMAKELGPGSA